MDVVLNQDLLNYVYKDMPANYSQLQKAVFVYIKLCKLLTYDPEFYANNQSGMIARKHEDIARLATISTQETRVVCYEFAQIYAKLLSDLGLNYEIEGGLNYGSGHTSVKFRVGEYIVSADSVIHILGGDLYNAKINSELTGLKCESQNKQTLAQFKQECDFVYDQIIKTEEIQESDEGLFYDFLDMFDALCEKETVTMETKRKIFEKRCREIHLPTMDKITYIMSLAKAIFHDNIQNEQFSATIISKKEIERFNIRSVPTIIYAFNEQSFKTAPEQTAYMMMDSNGNLINIYKATIEQNFNVGAFKHISAGVRNKHTIPGIVTEVQSVK